MYHINDDRNLDRLITVRPMVQRCDGQNLWLPKIEYLLSAFDAGYQNFGPLYGEYTHSFTSGRINLGPSAEASQFWIERVSIEDYRRPTDVSRALP